MSGTFTKTLFHRSTCQHQELNRMNTTLSNINGQHETTLSLSTDQSTKLLETKADLTNSIFYKIFRIYLQLSLVVFGLVGNTLAIIVLRGSKFKSSSTSPYLVCLAISDNLNLLTGVALVPFMTFLGLNDLYITTVHISGCVVYLFVAYCSAQTSSWMVTTVTMERVGVVAIPHKSKTIFTTRKSYIVIAVIILILSIENGHIFFAHELVDFPTGGKACLIKQKFEYFSLNIWPWLDAIMYTFLPFGIILICNVIIISLVLKSLRESRAMSSISKESKQDNETNRMTQILLVISFFFILTTTPISLYLLFADPNDPDRISENSIGYITVNFTASLNHSCNFIMYSLSGPTFRGELKRLFSCKNNTGNDLNNGSSSRSRDVASFA